jgi:hypothetical protein
MGLYLIANNARWRIGTWCDPVVLDAMTSTAQAFSSISSNY